ncbi:MAG: aspartate kinase [Rikenellaceae bacterium]|nr:aspartate kinase [Rikenellaceae bacterium]
MKVLKFGGTSVGSAANMRKVADIIRAEGATVTVLSAMSGTTDALVKISCSVKNGKPEEVTPVLDMLEKKYTDCMTKLLTDPSDCMEQMGAVFDLIRYQVHQYVPGVSDRVIQAQGELLTSAIFNRYLTEQGERSVLLHAPGFMRTQPDGKVDMDHLNRELAAQTHASNTYYVTQGFICTNHKGELDNLGRGGSDYSAALMGVAVLADEVQIWTDIDGMHNNDPRYVEKTYPIRHMTFDDAAELAYFGAKILHPSTIQPCKEHGIPVRLKNTMDPTAPGTLITNEGEQAQFCAVAAKDNITVIRIHSLRMLMAYGFLRKVFEVFEHHKTSIDMITTSEVSVSLTIDNDEHLDAIVRELQALGTIEIERNNSIICIVGDMDHHKAGLVWRITGSLNTIPVKMISYGANDRSLVMLIETGNKIKALQDINHELFNL